MDEDIKYFRSSPPPKAGSLNHGVDCSKCEDNSASRYTFADIIFFTINYWTVDDRLSKPSDNTAEEKIDRCKPSWLYWDGGADSYYYVGVWIMARNSEGSGLSCYVDGLLAVHAGWWKNRCPPSQRGWPRKYWWTYLHFTNWDGSEPVDIGHWLSPSPLPSAILNKVAY